MKKLISVLLILVLTLMPFYAFAETAEPDETKIIMGDLTGDGQATASDARKVLRIAATLDPEDGVHMLSADADGNGSLTASDARTILRVSAGLSRFTYGFDENGIPCAVNVLNSDSYFLEATFSEDTFDGGEISMSLVKNGENLYLICKDLIEDKELNFGGSNITDIDIMIVDNVFYIVLNKEIAMPFPDTMLDEMGLSKNELYEYLNMITDFIPTEIGKATKTMFNDEEVFCYSYEVMGQNCLLYVGMNGELIGVYSVSGSVKTVPIVGIKKISDSTSEYFDMNKYIIF